TLRATLDWSYDLLSEPERLLLRRLSVFAGGWTLEAAEEVCGCVGVWVSPRPDHTHTPVHPYTHTSIPPCEVLDLLSGLVDQSLVGLEVRGEEARYRLLETTREYAGKRLAASGELDWLRDRHLAYFGHLAERAKPHLLGGNTAW